MKMHLVSYVCLLFRLYPGRPVLSAHMASTQLESDIRLEPESRWERDLVPLIFTGETSMAAMEAFVGVLLTADICCLIINYDVMYSMIFIIHHSTYHSFDGRVEYGDWIRTSAQHRSPHLWRSRSSEGEGYRDRDRE